MKGHRGCLKSFGVLPSPFFRGTEHPPLRCLERDAGSTVKLRRQVKNEHAPPYRSMTQKNIGFDTAPMILNCAHVPIPCSALTNRLRRHPSCADSSNFPNEKWRSKMSSLRQQKQNKARAIVTDILQRTTLEEVLLFLTSFTLSHLCTRVKM